MKKFGILSLFLIAMCAMVSVALADGDYKTVNKGNTVFIGEEGLNITAPLDGSTQIAYFAPGTNLNENPVPTAVVDVADASNFYVSPSNFNGRTGNWYAYPSAYTEPAFRVEVPSINVKVWDRSAGVDVSGKSVSRSSLIDFKIETNLYLIKVQRNPSDTSNFDFDVKLTTPEGAVYTSVYNKATGLTSLVNIPVSSSLYYWANDDNKAWYLDISDASGKVYPAGSYKVRAVCDINNIDISSGETSVTIASEGVKITSEKTAITRGSGFTMSITGQPKTDYYIFVKSTQADPAPVIINSQQDVVKGADPGYITESGKTLENSVPTYGNKTDYFARVRTDSSGHISVGFQTNMDTKDKRYVIRVEQKFGSQYKSDEFSITVSEGKISVVAEGDGFVIGDEIVLSGICTESDTVYFFITGANLPGNGGKLSDPRSAVTDNTPSTFEYADVQEDDSFEYKWRTESLSIDSGAYTVYAVSGARDKNHLGDVQYATTSISIKKPYLTATVTNKNIARGDKFYIKGDAGTESGEGIAIWIFGKNYLRTDKVSVNDDATYEYEFKRAYSEDLANGQYYIVVQHPMENNQFDVWLSGDYVLGTYPVSGNIKFKVKGSGSLQGSDAANALVKALDDSAIDDRYVTTDFFVADPIINIDTIKDVVVGSKVNVVGTTNLAVGNELLIEVRSSSFKPTQKTQSGEFSGDTKTVKVISGDGSYNKFVAEFDTTSFKVDEYLVTVTGIIVPASGSTSFNVVEVTPTPTPTPTPIPTTVVTTAVPTPEVTPPIVVETTNATPEPTPTPTKKSPGFGIVVAIVGLCIVAYLVVRKQ